MDLHGYHGCVTTAAYLNPNETCLNFNNIQSKMHLNGTTKDKYIVKFFYKKGRENLVPQKVFEKDIAIAKKIESIDPDHVFTAKMLCSGIEKIKTGDIGCQERGENTPYIIYKFGGVSLETLGAQIDQFSFTGKMLESYWDNIVVGVLKLIEKEYPHSDIKEGNILFDERTHKFILIDFHRYDNDKDYKRRNEEHLYDLYSAFSVLEDFNYHTTISKFINNMIEYIEKLLSTMPVDLNTVVAEVKRRGKAFRIFCKQIQKDDDIFQYNIMKDIKTTRIPKRMQLTQHSSINPIKHTMKGIEREILKKQVSVPKPYSGTNLNKNNASSSVPMSYITNLNKSHAISLPSSNATQMHGYTPPKSSINKHKTHYNV